MFIRVDDRLVHGQVVTAWIKELGVKNILVADDTAARMPIIAKGLTMATPKSVKLTIKNVEDAIMCINDFEEESVLIVTKEPASAKRIIEGNMNYNWTLNVGNVGMAAGRKKYAQTVHLDDSNYEAIKSLLDNEKVDVFMQTVPGQAKNKF